MSACPGAPSWEMNKSGAFNDAYWRDLCSYSYRREEIPYSKFKTLKSLHVESNHL